jgi:hypothetical protein
VKTHATKLQNPESGFGGFKKGFLFGGSSQKSKEEKAKKSKPEDDLPFIKAQDQHKNDQYKMPEVQAAMDASQAFLQNKGKF